MANVLIRGIPETVHRQIEKIAKEDDLSVNQMMVQILRTWVKQEAEKRKKSEDQLDVYQRIEKLREKIRQKYGVQEDSWKLIREAREERTKRWE